MSRNSEIISFFKTHPGVHSLQEIKAHRLPYDAVYRLRDSGVLVCVSRGIYRLADADPSRHGVMAELALRIPKGVFCLISALDYHEIGTQLPFEQWVALPRGTSTAKVDEYSVRYCFYSNCSYDAGIETHVIDGTKVKIYCPAKTIVDCFKYRNKLGLDVAIEALREGLRSKKANVAEILKYADVCRMKNVIMPYLEGML